MDGTIATLCAEKLVADCVLESSISAILVLRLPGDSLQAITDQKIHGADHNPITWGANGQSTP
jgi:hypothetical protein